MNSTQYRNVAADLSALDENIKALLPPQYEHCYTDVSPNSMGSAGLAYDRDGKVAWDRIWTSFCDLALARRAAASGSASRASFRGRGGECSYAVSRGCCRDRSRHPADDGIERCERLRTGMDRPAMLVGRRGRLGSRFAVTAENVTARRRHATLQVPAGPDFRVPERDQERRGGGWPSRATTGTAT